MRNRSGALLRRSAEGESVLVTNNGVPAAMVVTVATDPRTRLIATGRLWVGTGLDLSALETRPAVGMGSPAKPDSTEDILTDDRSR